MVGRGLRIVFGLNFFFTKEGGLYCCGFGSVHRQQALCEKEE